MMRVLALLVVLLALVPGAAHAQLDPELRGRPDPEAPRSPPGGRDELRPRWGFTLGGYGGSIFLLEVPVWEARTPGSAWVRTGETRSFDTTSGGFVATLQLGVQTEEIAGVAVLRAAMGASMPLHLSLSAVAELTLLDWLQLAIGPSLDVVQLGIAAPELSTVPTTRVLERHVEAFWDRTIHVAGVAPGIEMRVAAATGGGPYERRGFVVVSFLHLTFLEREVLVLGGLEVGFQSY